MLNTTFRKCGHSSALLNVDSTFEFLECVVFFLRPFLWSILAFLILWKLSVQTLQNVLQQMGNRITILHPTLYRMAKNLFMSYFKPL